MAPFLALVLAVAAVFVLRPDVRDWLLGGLAARVVVRIRGGEATVMRGRLPGSVLDDLRMIANSDPTLAGNVHLLGKGAGLRIRVRGLPEGPAQRVRNVVNLRRRDV